MKRFLLLIFISTSVLIFSDCQNKHERAIRTGSAVSDKASHKEDILESIIIYGSKTCVHCLSFLEKLDQEGINYTFKEVDNDDANFQEMYAKIKAIKFKGYVNYPVVDVDGEILVAPDFDEFYRVYR